MHQYHSQLSCLVIIDNFIFLSASDQSYYYHIQTIYIKWHSLGCDTINLSRQQLQQHMMDYQEQHLKLQIDAIAQLQATQQQLQYQMQTVFSQQENLTTLITSYEEKIKTLESSVPNSPSRSHRSDPPPYPSTYSSHHQSHNLQFNINMNNHNKSNQNDKDIELKDDSLDRWQRHPVIQKIQQLQNEIVIKQSTKLQLMG